MADTLPSQSRTITTSVSHPQLAPGPSSPDDADPPPCAESCADSTSSSEDTLQTQVLGDQHRRLTKPLMDRHRPQVAGPRGSRVPRVIMPSGPRRRCLLVLLCLLVALVVCLCALLLYALRATPACSDVTSSSDDVTLVTVHATRGGEEVGNDVTASGLASDDVTRQVVGCSRLAVEDVWVVGLPKLLTESAVRMIDVTGDGVLDVLLGFATGADAYNAPDIVCDIYFSGTRPCLGGLLALDGASGGELWRHYSPHEIFSVNCGADLDRDGLDDCIIGGRVGTFEAVSSRDGRLIWNFTDPSVRVKQMNFYTGCIVTDLNGDSVPDIVNIHGGDPFGEPGSETRLSGKLVLVSGRDGGVLSSLPVPDGRESYYSPVLHRGAGGRGVVLFGTGGETHPGSLWAVDLLDLYHNRGTQPVELYRSVKKGVMTPPVLIDLTRDRVADIVFATYNSTMLALDGATYKPLWNFTYPQSETYATPAPGFYNEDDVPDFMVHWQYGPGYPIYYHSVTTVVDGLTGRPLIIPYIKSSVGAQASPLTVSVEGRGNDIFIYWSADCLEHEGEGGEFDFVKGTNVHEKSRSDFCRLRFKTEGFSRLYALNRHVTPPGFVLYESESRKAVEHAWAVNTSAEAQLFLQTHPQQRADYEAWLRHTARASGGDPSHPGEARGGAGNGGGLGQGGNRDGFVNEGRGSMETGNRERGTRSIWSSGDEKKHGKRNRNRKQETRIENEQIQENMTRKEKLERRRMFLEERRNKDDSMDNKEGERKWLGSRSSDVAGEGLRHVRSLNEGVREGFEGGDERRHRGGARRERDDLRGGGGRGRRHVGPHDEEGLQRLISTGTLAPPLLPPDSEAYRSSMDVVFATYWFYPSRTKALLPLDQRCIEQRMAGQEERFDQTSLYFGMDTDGYEHAVTDECLKLSGHQLPDQGTYQSQDLYTPYSVNMGQLTVYRLRLKCTCPPLPVNQRCSSLLPFDRQQWAGYMGSRADSHWG